jgi:Acyl-coenzyme A:6-aminopenicillanic acid acyl-transferase
MGSNKEKIIFKDGVYYFGKGWRQKIGNIDKIYVKGTDYERGFQMGKLLSNEVKEAIDSSILFNSFAKREMPAFLKRLVKKSVFIFKRYLLFRYKKGVESRFKEFPDWVGDIAEGIGHGAGVDSFFIKLINIPGNDEPAVNQPFESSQVHSCCSFAFKGKDGNLYHGKNLDWVPVDKHIDLFCFLQQEDENGNSFSVIGVPGILTGYEFALNSHGISIGLTGRFFRGKYASKLSSTKNLMINLYRYGKNLAHIQKMYNTGTGFDRASSLLISSQSDADAQLFEVSPIGAAITSSKNGIPWTTNTYVHPKLRKYNKHPGTIFGDQFCDPRYKRLEKLLAQNPQTREDAFNILADTLQPGFEERSFLGQASINRFISHVSVLMVRGKEGEGVWIAKARTYSAHHEYSFFDFSDKPQQKTIISDADPLIETPAFKHFKDFSALRESRYYISSQELLEKAEQLVRKEPGNPIFILFLAQNFMKYNKPQLSLDVLNKHPLPWCADYWYCLGQSQKSIQQYENAKINFAKAKTLPSIDGFDELVQLLCLVQLVKVNTHLNLNQEIEVLRKEIKVLQDQFATPHVGMPDYPFINNISEQIENIVM